MSRTKTRTAASVVAILLAQNLLAPLALAQDFRSPMDNEPRLMFYLSKGFGNSRELRSAPQLGLRFERSFQLDAAPTLIEPLQRPTFNQTLVDLRWTSGFGQSLHLFGAPLYQSPLQLNSSEAESSGGEEGSSWETGEDDKSLSEVGESSGGYGYYVLAAVIGLGVLCVAEVVICEDNRNYDGPPRDTGPASDSGT